eukprot:IDg17828t1
MEKADICKHCDLMECEREHYRESLAALAKLFPTDKCNEIRKNLYKFYVFQKWGHLGRGVRVRVRKRSQGGAKN